MANGVRALLEYLTTVPQIVGTLVWMSAMKAAVTLSASRLGNEVGRVLKIQHVAWVAEGNERIMSQVRVSDKA